MTLPAPTPLGKSPTTTLLAPFGWIPPELLAVAADHGRAPVFMHHLGDEKSRQQRGPRELREETVAALEAAGWDKPWGLGAVCASIEDAAQFATGGFTWFTLELGAFLEPRAGTMSLDELDSAIVALEDSGVFREGWHERYLEGSGQTPTFPDELLARFATRYGAAIAEAQQMVEAIRVSFSERGDLPDLEFSLRRGPAVTSPDDLAFFTAEALSRGLVHGGVTRFAPALGPWFEMGRVEAAEIPPSIDELQRACLPGAILSLPRELAEARGSFEAHHDSTADSALAWLRRLARNEPARFRAWLEVARDLFPTSKAGWNLSTSEDDLRFLPEVADDALVSTFIDTNQGCQLLLATWDDIVSCG